VTSNMKRRPPKFIVFLGPDGAGKTSVIQGVMRRLKAEGSEVAYFHGRPPIRGALSTEAPDPGGLAPVPRRPKPAPILSFFISMAHLGKNLLQYSAGYWIRVFPELRKGRIVLADRYTYWYLLDPDGIQYWGPRLFARAFARIVPRADLVLVPWAPAEAIFARKPELDVEMIKRQQSRCEYMMSTYSHFYRVDTSIALDETIDAAMNLIRGVESPAVEMGR